MTFKQLLKTTDLENSFLIGYYGGGNYGDELLLEVLQNLLAKQGVKNLTIAYQRPEAFSEMHKDFGFKRVLMYDKLKVLKTLLKNKNVIIGGGGLWGLDMNLNTFLLSVFLFIARIFGKKVYLLGVGYYSSTTTLGRIGAFLAAKSAAVILARDDESLQNFSRYTKKVHLDHDLSWATDEIDLNNYRSELALIEKKIKISEKTVFIGLRHFKARHKNNFSLLMEQVIAANPNKQFIVALLENKNVDTESYSYIQAWRQKYSNIQPLDFTHNPLGLFAFFQKHHRQLLAIAPQFHIIITAHLTSAPFLPVVYDNKVREMLKKAGVDETQHIAINDLQLSDVQAFIDKHIKGD
ncbi:MAG TPA: polysaccharide pyruvyl transferase family protein [Verrucomicrobiae bacterium]|nr:polysaccharide pyruvyl transferase family protein [Verrucomicrobiae bacterium]